MKKLLYAISTILCISSCVPTDELSPDPADVFVKYHGSGANEAVDLVTYTYEDAAQTKVGYIILGSHESGEHTDFYLIKTDEKGNEVDSAMIDLADGSVDIPKRIEPIGNGEYLLVGYIEGSGINEFTGVWGVINDALEVTSGMHQVDNVQLTDIVKTTENDGVDKVVLMGHELRGQGAGANYDIMISKRSISNDSTYWNKYHGFTGDELAHSIFENQDGSLLMVGTTTSDVGQGTNLYILGTNHLGTADGSGVRTGVAAADAVANDIPHDVIKSSLGYSIVGSTVSGGQLTGFLMSVRPSGTVNETATHLLSNDYNGLQSQALAATKSAYNDIMVLGSVLNFSEQTAESGQAVNKLEQILVQRVNPLSGRVEGFDQAYGTTVGNDRAGAALTLPDGDILVAATVDFGSGTSLIGLLRLNRSGELKD